jgi:hypothetical protein
VTEAQRYRLLVAAATLHAALPLALGLLGFLAGSRDAMLIVVVAIWWSWPFVWLYPLWRARYDDTTAWWTGLVLSLLLLGLASPAMLFLSAVLAGART